MNLRHHRGAFADRAADALHRAGANVADGKHAGYARFERGGHVRRAARGGLTRQYESVRVERDAAAFQPLGLRIRADKQEDVTDRPLLLGPAASCRATTPR